MVEAAADDVGEEDAVVAGVDVSDRFALEMADGVFEQRHAASAVGDLEAVEGRRVGLEALAEVLEQVILCIADQIQNEGLALGQPVADVTAELHTDADHGRLEAGLHDPTTEHAGGPWAGAHGEDEDAAGDATEDGVEGCSIWS